MDDLDPATAASLDDLAACLRHVHLRADQPTYRTLEQHTIHASGVLPGTQLKRVRLTRSVLSDVLLGRKFPRKAFLLTFVDACGVDIENDRRWEQAWDRLAAQERQATPPGEAEKIRQENEELRRQIAALKQEAETTARTVNFQQAAAGDHTAIAESSLEWERKYISVNPETGTIDVYDRPLAIQIFQIVRGDIGQSHE